MADVYGIDGKVIEMLIDTAVGMMDYSYAPYSHYHVGAALMTAGGKIYTGCNIENAAFTPTNCAERTAFFKAISEGETDFKAICIVGGKHKIMNGPAQPCGVCRQVMMEFCDPKTFLIIMASGREKYEIHTLGEMLPMGFGPLNLG